MVYEKNIVGFWNQAEVIKMCPLVLELKKSKKLDTKVCGTVYIPFQFVLFNSFTQFHKIIIIS